MAKQIEIDFSTDDRAPEFCPHCGQRLKSWKKAIISTAVASLCRLVAMYSGQAIHHDDFTVLAKDRNFSQLRLWGLVSPAANDDRMKRSSGKWHPTKAGIAFVIGSSQVPKYIVTSNNRLLRFEGPLIGVREALGSRFDYYKLILSQERAA